MDNRLHEKLTKWWDQIERLDKVERIYRELEASEKSVVGIIVAKDKSGDGITEKTARAKSSEDYINICKGLAIAKVDFHTEERKLELFKKSFDAEYLGAKQEFEIVSKRNPNIGD